MKSIDSISYIILKSKTIHDLSNTEQNYVGEVVHYSNYKKEIVFQLLVVPHHITATNNHQT